MASSLIYKGIEFESAKITEDKLRMKLAEQMKLCNANSKLDTINNNVVELEGIIKGNVNKMINNMSDL